MLRKPCGVGHHDLPRFDIAHEGGAHDVERAGLARHDPRPGRLNAPPEDQRPHAERIAAADQRLVGQRHQGIRPDHLFQGVDQPVDHRGVQADGDKVDEHLAVGGGLEQAAAPDQRTAQDHGVGKVAVVRDRQAAELEIGEQRLHVAQHGVAGGGIAVVADRTGARQAGHDARVGEIVADQAHPLVAPQLLAVEAGDAGRGLAPVLQRVQRERGDRGGVGAVPHADHGAFLMRMVVVAVWVERGRHGGYLGRGHQGLATGLACALPTGSSALPRGCGWNRSSARAWTPFGGGLITGR